VQPLQRGQRSKSAVAQDWMDDRHLQVRKAIEVDGRALRMDTEVTQSAQRIQPFDTLEVDVPEPDRLQPRHPGQKIEVRPAEAEVGGAERARDPVPRRAGDAIVEAIGLDAEARHVREVVRYEEPVFTRYRHRATPVGGAGSRPD